jgi:hypothetical protein
MDAFVSVQAGALPAEAFFSPRSVERLVAAAV